MVGRASCLRVYESEQKSRNGQPAGRRAAGVHLSMRGESGECEKAQRKKKRAEMCGRRALFGCCGLLATRMGKRHFTNCSRRRARCECDASCASMAAAFVIPPLWLLTRRPASLVLKCLTRQRGSALALKVPRPTQPRNNSTSASQHGRRVRSARESRASLSQPTREATEPGPRRSWPTRG